MYELKRMGRYLRVNLLGPDPCMKKNLHGGGLTKVEKHWPGLMTLAVSRVVKTNEGRTVNPPLPHALGNYCGCP